MQSHCDQRCFLRRAIREMTARTTSCTAALRMPTSAGCVSASANVAMPVITTSSSDGIIRKPMKRRLARLASDLRFTGDSAAPRLQKTKTPSVSTKVSHMSVTTEGMSSDVIVENWYMMLAKKLPSAPEATMPKVTATSVAAVCFLTGSSGSASTSSTLCSEWWLDHTLTLDGEAPIRLPSSKARAPSATAAESEALSVECRGSV